MQTTAEVSDRIFSAQISAHFGGRSFSADQGKRDEWIYSRTEQIMRDTTYTPILFAHLIEGDKRDLEALEAVKTLTACDWMSAVAFLHQRLTKKARMIAESEAVSKWGW